MKRLFFSATVATVFALGMTSCKKDYNCECKETTGNGATFETTNYPNTSLVDAREACKDRQSLWQNTSKPNTVCTIL